MLRFTSTSFLLPSMHSWNSLKAKYEVDFGEYGDWHSVLFMQHEVMLAWVVFLQDIFSDDDLSNASVDIDLQIEQVLLPLSQHVSHSEKQCIVAWSGYNAGSVISNARQPSSWHKIKCGFENALYKLAEENKNLYIVNLDSLFAVDGFNNAFSLRNYYASRCRLSSNGIRIVADAVDAVITRVAFPSKKLLVLDCDNTLWGGVIGEIGLAGIVLGTDGTGKAFTDFQTAIKRLSQAGLLLAIASKNNEQEVWDVFENHGAMILKRENIVSAKINWNEKSENVKLISEELDLGLDSFVFWDDNPIEREKMRIALPEVTTIEAPEDVYKWPELVKSLDCFTKFTTTVEDIKKNDQYRSRAAFVSEKKSTGDVNSFLKSISMKPSMCLIDNDSFTRAEQLCAKTNQFNLRTVRHTIDDLKKFSAKNEAFIVQLNDQYGEHGKIAVVIATRISDSVAFLDTFLMSCRVLGRFVESWILAKLIAQLKEAGYKYLLAEFIPTGKNNVAQHFLEENAFRLGSEENVLVQDYKNREKETKRNVSSGIFYYADIETIQIPHLDIFNY